MTSTSKKKITSLSTIRILGLICLYLALTIAIGTTLSIFLGLISKNFGQSANEFTTLLGALTTIPVTYLIYKIYNKKRDYEIIDWDFKQFKKYNDFIYSFLIVVLTFVWIFIVSFLMPSSEQSETTKVVSNMGLWGIFIAVIIAPITEEILFRGILKDVLIDKNNKIYILSSAIVFGLAHIQITGNLSSDILPIIVTGFLGGLSAYSYSKTKNIYVPIMGHLIYNSIVMFFAMKG